MQFEYDHIKRLYDNQLPVEAIRFKRYYVEVLTCRSKYALSTDGIVCITPFIFCSLLSTLLRCHHECAHVQRCLYPC